MKILVGREPGKWILAGPASEVTLGCVDHRPRRPMHRLSAHPRPSGEYRRESLRDQVPKSSGAVPAEGPLGEWRKRTYQIAQGFRSYSRRGNRRIVEPTNCCCYTEGARKDKRDGMFFDRNRLGSAAEPRDPSRSLHRSGLEGACKAGRTTIPTNRSIKLLEA